MTKDRRAALHRALDCAFDMVSDSWKTIKGTHVDVNAAGKVVKGPGRLRAASKKDIKQTPKGPIIARKIKPVSMTENNPKRAVTPEVGYHATSAENLASIAKKGLVPSKPWVGSPGSVYFNDAQYPEGHSAAKEQRTKDDGEGGVVWLKARIPKGYVAYDDSEVRDYTHAPADEAGSETAFSVQKTIPPEYLYVETPDGKSVPIKEYMKTRGAKATDRRAGADAMIGLWKYNTATGYWKLERNCDDATAQTWLNIFKRDEPGTAFKLSRSKPKDTPAKDRRAALHRALGRVMDGEKEDYEAYMTGSGPEHHTAELLKAVKEKRPFSIKHQFERQSSLFGRTHNAENLPKAVSKDRRAALHRALDRVMDARRGRAGDEEEESPYERKVAMARPGTHVTLEAGYGGHGGSSGNDFMRLSSDTGAKVVEKRGGDIWVDLDTPHRLGRRWRMPIQAHQGVAHALP